MDFEKLKALVEKKPTFVKFVKTEEMPDSLTERERYLLVTFIKNRMGSTYLCADDPETLDMQVILMDVAHKEWCERNSLTHFKTPDCSLPSEVDGMKLD